MTARCDFSDLPQDQCAHCLGHATPRPAAVADRPSWLREARYRGQCAGCGEPFTVGAPIEFDPQTGGWLAECCATDAGAER